MAIFMDARDIGFMRHVNREMIHNIINQTIGYYKLMTDSMTANVYGETSDKVYYQPILMNALISASDPETSDFSGTPSVNRTVDFYFLRDDFVDLNMLSDLGDVLVWNDDYYEVKQKIENQFLGGRNPEFAYTELLKEYGANWSTLLRTVYVNPETVNVSQTRWDG